MTTKQIDCALELSYSLNFSKAAEALYISQPSLTYQIQSLETEIGFSIFERSSKGTILTPAGRQFCKQLAHIKKELQTAIEQGQNMSYHYTEALNLCFPMRSCLYFLPQIMQKFSQKMPSVALNISFIYDSSRTDLFLKKELDILFGRDTEFRHFSGLSLARLFESRFYLITRHDDPLSKLEIVTEQDLDGRTFLIGGDTPAEMSAIQQRIIRRGKVTILNSHTLDNAFAHVAAGNAISLAPGFANDHHGEFVWIPFDCPEKMNCVFACHKDDRRKSTQTLIELTQEAYMQAGVIPL